MPEYSFKNRAGQVSHMYFPVAEAPKFGSVVTDENGVLWTRVIDIPRVNGGQDHHFVSRSLPRWDPSAPRHDEQGRPQFDTKKEVTEYVAKTDGDWTYGEL